MRDLSLDTAITADEVEELWRVYDAVFSDHADRESWRSTVWDRHSGRDGFRLARARVADVLAGFAYGYTGRTGQWWTDTVRDVLDPVVADEWLDGHFELVSIGVQADARGAGIGHALLDTLCRGLPHDRLLLMTTADASHPARVLYDSDGWRVLGPGIGEATVVMGRPGRAS